MSLYKHVIFVTIFSLFIFANVHAQNIDELKNKINTRNEDIKKLEEEIKKYQIEIDAVAKEADSLKNALKNLDISKKKLQADTKITENKIANKNLEIQELSLQIGDKSERIIDSRRVISQSLYNISRMSSASAIETLLSQKSLSGFWNNADELSTLQGSLQGKIKDLKNLKLNLEENKKLTERKKAELVTLNVDLKNQTKIIAETAREKDSILKETNNTEASYKKLLASRKAQKEAFEKEIFDLENALKLAVDPNSIPNSGKGILAYPFDVVRITQYFGNTEFATKNPQIYSGGGHNGVDFGAPIGTPVKSAASGVVIGAGNTDLVCPRVSYGKWILVRHNNGLTTVYAHLSLVSAVVGQTVERGEIIAYSGNTGMSTGPHLHFTVYASDGVTVGTYNFKSCAGASIKMPLLIKRDAYLNPLSYL